jgi:hypothetical protein
MDWINLAVLMTGAASVTAADAEAVAPEDFAADAVTPTRVEALDGVEIGSSAGKTVTDALAAEFVCDGVALCPCGDAMLWV